MKNDVTGPEAGVVLNLAVKVIERQTVDGEFKHEDVMQALSGINGEGLFYRSTG